MKLKEDRKVVMCLIQTPNLVSKVEVKDILQDPEAIIKTLGFTVTKELLEDDQFDVVLKYIRGAARSVFDTLLIDFGFNIDEHLIAFRSSKNE